MSHPTGSRVYTRPETEDRWKNSLIEFKKSLRSWYTIISFFVSSIAVFSAIVNVFSISLIDFMNLFVRAFAEIFHAPIDIIARIFNISVPYFWKNVVVFYIAFGGAVMRTEMRLIMIHYGKNISTITNLRTRLRIKENHVLRILYSIGVILIWPFFLVNALRRPMVFRFEPNDDISFPVRYSSSKKFFEFFKGGTWYDYDFLFDMRVVFLFQILSIGIICTLLGAVNALGI
jgi:hypothetical protein